MLDISAQLLSKGKIKNRQTVHIQGSWAHYNSTPDAEGIYIRPAISSVDLAKTAINVQHVALRTTNSNETQNNVNYLVHAKLLSSTQLEVLWKPPYGGGFTGSSYIHIALEIVEFE